MLTEYAKEDKRLRSDLKSFQDKNAKLSAEVEKLTGRLKRARKAAVDEFKASDDYQEQLRGHAENQRSAFIEEFKLSDDGQAWLKDGMRTALQVARQWIRNKHPDTDVSTLYLEEDKGAGDS